jgi:2-methylcitrate dehydratase PrpD
VRVHTPYAALANGAFAHAFEQDSVRDPGVGAHPGASLVPPVLAMCEETGADGKTAITAFVAGCEVMLRVAAATHHSPEKIGFHSPGLTGCYGAAIAAGRVLGLGAEQLANAIGVAGSLSSGLLAFTKSEGGAMIKRLHLGRASESGILAARLAAEGYCGPETVLEGRFGFLEAYCRDLDTEPALLTAHLGADWEVMRICMKRYACHINAHTPVQSTRELMAEHGFGVGDVKEIVIEGAERLVTHHTILEPGDLMQAQYSVPFCVAVALHRDPDDPRAFAFGALEDAAIRASCRSVTIRPVAGRTPRSTRVTVRLKDGRDVARDSDTFKGMPRQPLTRADLRRKFALLTAGAGDALASVFDRLERLESQPRFSL